MAIDDALVLARALRDEAGPPATGDAFSRYEHERIPRTSQIVTLSRRFGAIAAWRNPALVWARETAMRAAPRALLEREIQVQIDQSVGTL